MQCIKEDYKFTQCSGEEIVVYCDWLSQKK